jgi:hypothetical protein
VGILRGRKGGLWRDFRDVKAAVSVLGVSLIMIGELSCVHVQRRNSAGIMPHRRATLAVYHAMSMLRMRGPPMF